MLKQITPLRAALVILVVATATIAGAWIFEYFGYAPCELCLQQRWAYYAAIPAGTHRGHSGSILSPAGTLWPVASRA
jgi:disulfide bond formation protein DsbB